MTSRFTRFRSIPFVFWILALTAIFIWSLVPGYVVGWDLQVYRNALVSLQAGHDPYADGIAVQRAFHSQLTHAPNEPTPFTYVYSPLTLPLLRWIGLLPSLLSGGIYWLLYGVGVAAAIWVGMQAVEIEEERVFALLVPVAVFFPGLLQQDVLFSGNVAYILYGMVFAAAAVGWRRGQWAWFYAAVLAASCCKAPLLSLLAIPVVTARRQWISTIFTGAAGLAIFAVQPLIWPSLFRHYLEAVELQFSFNHDFSSSPAGLLADALYYRIPYAISSTGIYLLYALPIFGVLVYLSRRYFAGEFSLKQWMPVVLLGSILLNPRIMEYDVAPITIPMALVAWRFFARSGTLARTIVGMSVFFAVINILSAIDIVKYWRPVEGSVLSLLFVAGAWNLFTTARESRLEPPGAVEEDLRLHVRP